MSTISRLSDRKHASASSTQRFNWRAIPVALVLAASLQADVIEEPVSPDGLEDESACVAMDLDGHFVIGWQERYVNEHNTVDSLIRQYTATGVPSSPAQLVSADCEGHAN